MTAAAHLWLEDEKDHSEWPEPDMAVLRLHRRPPPTLPLQVFGPWEPWIIDAGEAGACPVDYVAIPLLASTSALIGHARWAQATPGWAEPPHVWTCLVGDSGTNKSPGSDQLLGEILPEIERRMMREFPEQLREWRAAQEIRSARTEQWKAEVRAANKAAKAPPLPPPEEPELNGAAPPEAPRLRQNDTTIERVATVLANAAPKGLLIVRDELAGWIDGMNSYNDGGRAFWIEAYGGRPYRVERQKYPTPIDIPRLAVAVFGSSQPERLAAITRGIDDGLLSPVLWAWPDPVPFRLGRKAPNIEWALSLTES